MKSLLISGTYFPPQIGGISHFMASIASTLGPDRVCCLTSVPADDRVSYGNGVGPRVYRRPAAFAHARWVQAAAVAATMTEIMLRDRPRIVQLATTGEGYLGLWLKRLLGLPFIIYAHGNEILSAMKETWPKPRLALQQADRVLANSRFTANLVHQVGVDASRIEVVHPGCDVDRFRPLPADSALGRRLLGPRWGDRVILTVGGLVARKGHDVVIEALPKLPQRVPGVTYLIVGDGPYRGTLERLAESLGVSDKVVFAGHVAANDLPAVYALSDVFVMPSRDQSGESDVEGFGLVFLEAGACAKPVIGGRSGGIPDAIVEGATGFLVDARDPGDIAKALERLLGNSALAIRMGEQGRLRAVKDFSWTQVGDRIQAILDKVVQERSGARAED